MGLGIKNPLKREKSLIETIHKEALDIYSFDTEHNKFIGHGVKIRVMNEIDFDIDKAFVWAQEHKIALKLDNVAFKKIANAQQLGFVRYMTFPTVTIPKEIKVDED